MARLEIIKQTTVGISVLHTSTDWQVAYDDDFTKILTESLGDTVNLLSWDTRLEDDTGKVYDGTDRLFMRCRVRYGTQYSKWLIMHGCINGGLVTFNCGFPYTLPGFIPGCAGQIVDDGVAPKHNFPLDFPYTLGNQ